MFQKLFSLLALSAVVPTLAFAVPRGEGQRQPAEGTQYCTRSVDQVNSVGKLGPKAKISEGNCVAKIEGRSANIASVGISPNDGMESRFSRETVGGASRSGSMKTFQ